MGKVYANGMEVCSGGMSGQAIAAMPDVCWTQPMAPPTPQGVPVPYPANGMASDLADGSTNVKIGGKPIALKDKSYLKKVTGDEAGIAGTKGLVSQKNSGKMYFAAWSMNVKIEGLNVVRHMDIATLNHDGNKPGNTPPWPFVASMRPPTPADESKCTLRPYRPKSCPKGTTAHHCVPDHCFRMPGKKAPRYSGAISRGKGLCVCVTGEGKSDASAGGELSGKDYPSAEEHYTDLAEHGRIHMLFDALEARLGALGAPENSARLDDLEDAAADTVAVVTGCDPADLKRQLREHHDAHKMPPDSRWRADPFGREELPPFGTLGTKTGAGW